MLYDSDNLYFAVYAYDSAPDLIVLGSMARDGNVAAGDLVRIFLDPGQTRRDGYSFEVGSAGGRRDALVQNNGEVLIQWDTLWSAGARVVEDGWVAEIAIPFRSLSYDRASSEWGFDFTRAIRRKQERIRWTSHSASINLYDLTQSRTLTGIAGLQEGVGLDAQLYGRLNFKQDWEGEDRGALSGSGSANVYYKITPALTGTLTLNPDFSDSPLDPRQINLSRFSLFTPETRDFFLQDAAAFEFGGRNFPNQNGRPFFSRNIGLVEGRPVTVLGGGKLSGKYGDIGIGALSARTNPTRTTPAQTLSAARITTPLFAESKLGLIVTNGDPTGLSDNTVAGADFQYRDSNFLGPKILQADFYFERSFSNTEGDDNSFGLTLNYPNEPWAGYLRLKQIGQDFSPALGFLNRAGIRGYEASAFHTTRFPGDNYLRTLQFGVYSSVITDLSDQVQSRNHIAWAQGFNQRADTVRFEVKNFSESVPVIFSLPGSLAVPAGEYHWTNAFARFDTTEGRPYSVFAIVECCSFYDGDYTRAEFGLTFRCMGALEISPRYNVTFITMPTGYVAIHVPTFDFAVNFTPDMQFVIQTQFDNISRGLGFSARYRWEYDLANEIFVAFGQSAQIPGTNFVAQQTQVSLRLGHTLRF